MLLLDGMPVGALGGLSLSPQVETHRAARNPSSKGLQDPARHQECRPWREGRLELLRALVLDGLANDLPISAREDPTAAMTSPALTAPHCVHAAALLKSPDTRAAATDVSRASATSEWV